MAISGLVIHLEQDELKARAALEAIAAHPRLTLGDRVDRCQPAVLEMADDREGRDMHGWLHALPGVHHADVVYVHFGDDASAAAADESAKANS